MSVGCFQRVVDSYADGFAHLAQSDVSALHAALVDNGFEGYVEPAAVEAHQTWHQHHTLGRAALDHCGSSSLRELAEEGRTHGGVRHTFQLGLLRGLGRRYFVPCDFRRPLQAAGLEASDGWFGSSMALSRELAHLAPALGIELTDGVVSDATALAILKHKPLGGTPLLSGTRSVWMMLWEAARLSAQHGCAVALAS